jgi:hypothetical protein
MSTQKLCKRLKKTFVDIVYNEIPGELHGSILDPYRKAASIIEELDYTLIRPAWLNNRNEIDYTTTHKGEAFKNATEHLLERGRSRGQTGDGNLARNPK